MTSFTAPPLQVPSPLESGRVELIFTGIEQAGPSFEGRVFLNNPAADEHTPLTADMGYAGSFHVYGYGNVMPPALAEAKARRTEGSGPVAPIEQQLWLDAEALRTALERSDALTVTVVPSPVDPSGPVPERPFEQVHAVFGAASS